jgi:hypothetical protein
MHQIMHADVPKLLTRKTQHCRGGTIREDAFPLQIEAINTLSGGFEQQLESFARFAGFFAMLAMGYCA